MSEENPYQSPLEPCSVEIVDPDGLPIASSNRRVVNLIVDNLACRGFVFAVSFGLALIDGSLVDRPAPAFTIGVSLALVYYASQEILFGRTIGKLITGTKVVAPDGGPCTVTQIVGRTLCRLIPFEAFSFLGNGHPVGWHDKLSGTRVILVRR